MPIGVKLDEDLSPLVGDVFISAGYHVATVLSQKWCGMEDEELFRKVQPEDRLFVTADRGFGDIRLYVPGTHAEIVLLRPIHDRTPLYCALAQKLIDRYDLNELRGALTIVSAHRIRVRRAVI